MKHLILLLAFVSVAHAQPTEDPKVKAQAYYTQGQELYSAGKYVDAAEKFATAYDLDHDPSYLFNVAQAYRFGNACAKAAEYYRKFSAAVPNPPNKDKLARYIVDMDACAKKQSEPPPTGTGTNTGTGTSTGTATPPPPPPDDHTTTQPTAIDRASVPPPADDPKAGPRKIGLGLAVVGLAGIAIGTLEYFVFDSRRTDEDNFLKGCLPPSPTNPTPTCAGSTWLSNYDDKTRAAQRNMFIGYGVGVAALAAGAALYMLNRSSDHEVAVTPQPGGASVSTSFRF